jgi:hypothetical protein
VGGIGAGVDEDHGLRTAREVPRPNPRVALARVPRARGIFLRKSLHVSKVADDFDPYITNIPYNI